MVGEMSVWGNVLVGNAQSGKCPSGKCPSGKCQSGICSHSPSIANIVELHRISAGNIMMYLTQIIVSRF